MIVGFMFADDDEPVDYELPSLPVAGDMVTFHRDRRPIVAIVERVHHYASLAGGELKAPILVLRHAE